MSTRTTTDRNGSGIPYNSENITISSTPVGFSSSLVPSSGPLAGRPEEVYLTVDAASIRYTIDGTTPSSTVGHLFSPMQEPLRIIGYQALQQFRAIRSASTDATLNVTYLRRG